MLQVPEGARKSVSPNDLSVPKLIERSWMLDGCTLEEVEGG